MNIVKYFNNIISIIILCSGTILVSFLAHSQDGAGQGQVGQAPTGGVDGQSEQLGVTGATINSMKSLETQAQANRELANRLYTQSLKDESDAWKSYPPSVKLLTRSLDESRKGNLADKQAMASARAALSSIQSGDKNASLDISATHGDMNREEINNIATNPSKLWPTVKATLGAYGIGMTALGYKVDTPYGQFDIREGPTDSNDLKKILDYKKDDIPFLKNKSLVSEGVDAGISESKRFTDQQSSLISKDMKVSLNQIAANISSGNLGGVGNSGNKNPTNMSSTGPNEEEQVEGVVVVEKKPAANRPLFGRFVAGISPVQQAEKEKEEAKDFFARGESFQDIFKMIQKQYKSQEQIGIFIKHL